MTCDLSDHYATFAVVSTITKVKKTQNNDYKVRDMTKFNLEIFLNALNDQLNILIDSNISSPHELYDKFVTKFENVVDEFAPMRKASRKENKLRCRPWLTRRLKSIQIKNKMYNNLREKPDTSQSHKYKIYRNLLNRLIKQTKVDYYHNVLKNNKNNSKKVWNIVNELVYNRKQKNSGPTKILTDTGCTITDPQVIAEEFNKFFVSVGKRMAAKISANTELLIFLILFKL